MINHIKNAFLLSNSTVFRMYKILLLHIWLLHCTFNQESLHTDMDVPLKIFNFKPTWDRALADARVEKLLTIGRNTRKEIYSAVGRNLNSL